MSPVVAPFIENGKYDFRFAIPGYILDRMMDDLELSAIDGNSTLNKPRL